MTIYASLKIELLDKFKVINKVYCLFSAHIYWFIFKENFSASFVKSAINSCLY